MQPDADESKNSLPLAATPHAVQHVMVPAPTAASAQAPVPRGLLRPQRRLAGGPIQLPARLPVEVPAPTQPDEVFDRYARLVTATLGVPVGLVSLVSADGQVFPGAVGLPTHWQQTRCTGLSHSFCQHVVAHDSPLVVTDARQDPALADNLAIADIGVVAYAGFPLHDADGAAVGSLCAIDTQPRQWTQQELDVLADLAATAASELVLRRAVAEAAASRDAELEALARASAISEAMAVGYLVLDAAWCITYVNPEGRRLLAAASDQLDGGDLIGHQLWQVFPALAGSPFEDSYRRALDTGQAVTFEAYYPEPFQAWYEVRATPQDGGLALYFLDTTDRHEARAAVEQAGQQVAALGRIALSLSDAESIEELAAIMAEQGQAALGADGGAVAVPAADRAGGLVSYMSASLGEHTRTQYGQMPLDAPLPVTQAARTATRVLVRDQDACTAYSPLMAQASLDTGCQAWASLPLLAQGRLLGVLSIGWRQAQSFEAEQLELLETYAGQCAQALQRLAAREAERASAQLAHQAAQQALASAHAERLSAHRQASLVAIAQALADADCHQDVLSVLDAQGGALIPSSVWGLALRSHDGAAVSILGTEDIDSDVRTRVQHLPTDFALPVVHAATTGTSHYLSDLAETAARFPDAQDLYSAVGLQASASVPLRVRGALLGSLSVASRQVHTWSTDERDLLEAFAGLTAQALSRIAAHDAEQAALAAAAGISETLQRSMLTPPPEPDHLEVAVRYAAAADHAEVGGDWYDAFVTSDGLTSLVIGDVTGHDMRAAAVMGQLRNLVRGIGFTLGQPPAAVLAAVDRAAAGLGIDTVATAILAQVDQSREHRAAGTRLLRWSNAGHLPPLLIEADGTVRYLEPDSDLVLGWDPAITRHDHEVVLAPGATVLLYTDGLIERRGVSLDRGMAWLAQAAAELAGETTEELCSALVELVGDHLDDDVALLALRAHPEDGPRPVEAGPEQVPIGLDQAQRAAHSAQQ